MLNTRYECLAAVVMLAISVLVACAEDEKRGQHFRTYAAPVGAELAEAVAQALTHACPTEGLDDPEVRDRCADALATDPVLSASLRKPYVRWGGQGTEAGLNLDRSNTTRLDPLVWRRLYLSTFAFPGDHRVEQAGDRYIAHIAAVFRNALDAGEYPYPFWHSQPKWQSYERTQELLVFIEGDAISAALRSAAQDHDRPHVEREWDGRWQWDSERGEEPRVALYGFLFSKGNPNVDELEAAYRGFSEKQREGACTSCHNPSNPSQINPLEFFNYPNQALTGRHDIVAQLKKNLMPPASGDAAAGLVDDSYRQGLLALAEDFARAGDRALAYEEEH